jgi:hypothetical protein
MNSAPVRLGAYTKTIAGFNERRMSGVFSAVHERLDPGDIQ